MEAFHGQNSGDEKDEKHDALRDGEERLVAFRREDVEQRDVQERLHDEDEAIEVKRHDRADDVNPPRRTMEV